MSAVAATGSEDAVTWVSISASFLFLLEHTNEQLGTSRISLCRLIMKFDTHPCGHKVAKTREEKI
jgi:hypothetical protein